MLLARPGWKVAHRVTVFERHAPRIGNVHLDSYATELILDPTRSDHRHHSGRRPHEIQEHHPSPSTNNRCARPAA